MYYRNVLSLCIALLGFTMLSFGNPPEGVIVASELNSTSPSPGILDRPGDTPLPPAHIAGDSTRVKVDVIVKALAEKGRCRITMKVTPATGDSFYAGYDGRSGQVITDFNQPFEIGSCSKMFTATSILQLVEQEKLSLEDKLSDILGRPELLDGLMVTDSADYLGEIRLKNLLNHTSGLPEYFLDDDLMEIGIHGDSTLRFTPAQLVRMAKRLHEPQFKPGAQFKYTNTNYILLGMLIEQYTSLTFQEYIRQNILQKAGLKNTYFPSIDSIQGRAPGYYEGKPSQMPATLAGAAGEIVSTLDDMDLFIRSWARGDFYKSKAMMEQVRSSHYNPMGGGITYGLGVLNIGSALGHAGQTFGFQSFMGALPNGASFAFGIDDANESAWNIAMILAELLKTP
ncbi:serine hydrolase domain-containing protein [Robiginitalea sp.]|uniref:serine hydrolase domain-containing protein n=1 Tax=Robiginitalea sp. TaxID=1902411 RepID=UPI003C78BE74